jgi:DNA replication and repair protein RecF
MLNEQRKRDIEKGFSSVGPHRDDISFFLDHKPAKNFGSQGQCRSIVLSLKLSSVECIEHYRQDGMIFLIDDAVSELDENRTLRVYSLIENRGQVFVATPVYNGRSNENLKRCRVSAGKVIE